MLFKRKISVNEYLRTRLDLLFSQEQEKRWLDAKRFCGDDSIVSFRDDLYLMNLRSAHIKLLLMVLTKKYFRNDEMMLQIETFIDDYLDERDEWFIKSQFEVYGPALSSWPDGVLLMTRALMDYLTPFYEQDTLLSFRRMFYEAIAGFRADFKRVRLVS